MEASEPKWVNPILNIIKLGALQFALALPFFLNQFFHCMSIILVAWNVQWWIYVNPEIRKFRKYIFSYYNISRLTCQPLHWPIFYIWWIKKHLKNYNLKHWIQVNTNGVVPKFNFNLVQTLKLIVMFLFIEQCKDKSQIDKFKQEGTYQLDFLQ